jgi:hypothetical protein
MSRRFVFPKKLQSILSQNSEKVIYVEIIFQADERQVVGVIDVIVKTVGSSWQKFGYHFPVRCVVVHHHSARIGTWMNPPGKLFFGLRHKSGENTVALAAAGKKIAKLHFGGHNRWNVVISALLLEGLHV